MFHPIRAGTRGGQGLFKWEDVKDDKHRENYLGHSLLAPVGRWQKNKDLTWYAKDDSGAVSATAAATIDKELALIKQQEAEALAEALGYAPGTKRLTGQVSRSEIQRLVKADFEDAVDDEEQGLGFKSVKGRTAAADQGVIVREDGRKYEAVSGSNMQPIGPGRDLASPVAAPSSASAVPSMKRTKEEKKERKERKEQEKRERKEKRKEKRARKHAVADSDSEVVKKESGSEARRPLDDRARREKKQEPSEISPREQGTPATKRKPAISAAV
ncbi:hypothetical protein HKX48_007314 [Thoreauomyces humboldtii]|nr:hypothetical protein HKX48_007314 [Thoreauomyces humboldtii]